MARYRGRGVLVEVIGPRAGVGSSGLLLAQHSRQRELIFRVDIFSYRKMHCEII